MVLFCVFIVRVRSENTKDFCDHFVFRSLPSLPYFSFNHFSVSELNYYLLIHVFFLTERPLHHSEKILEQVLEWSSLDYPSSAFLVIKKFVGFKLLGEGRVCCRCYKRRSSCSISCYPALLFLRSSLFLNSSFVHLLMTVFYIIIV